MSNERTGTIVIVGASLAGGRIVEQLRRGGWEGRIVLVGAEKERPYDRPPLSKKLVRGQMEEEKLFFRPEGWYDENKIELHLGRRAVRLSSTARQVELDDGSPIDFDHLIVATGASARRLRCEGHQLEGVHVLRTLDDARAIRADVKSKKRVVVVGAGVIGAEVAASCRDEGLEVVMLEAGTGPLARAFGEHVGSWYGAQHRARGVDLRCSTTVTALRGNKRVEEVVTSDGQVIPCDFVVVGIGVDPDVAWLEGSGVRVDRGVIVDARCETSVPGIWAAGDVAAGPARALGGKHVIVESVDNAQTQGVTIAANLLGKNEQHDTVPFFWSDQFDLKLQSVGHVGLYDEVVVRGSMEKGAFAAFHLREGKPAFMIGVNRLKEIAVTKRLIAAGVAVPREVLADENASLTPFLPPKAAAT